MTEECIYSIVKPELSEIIVKVDSVRQTDFFHNKIVFCEDVFGKKMVAKFSSRPGMSEHEYMGYQIAATAGINTPTLLGLILDNNDQYGILTVRLDGQNLYRYYYEGAKYQLGMMMRNLHDFGRAHDGSRSYTWKPLPCTIDLCYLANFASILSGSKRRLSD